MITATQALQAIVTLDPTATVRMRACKDGTLRWRSPEVKSPLVSVMDETYGKRSFLYFNAQGADRVVTAQRLAAEIKRLGGTTDFGWQTTDPGCFSVPVSPFKGFHWWE